MVPLPVALLLSSLVIADAGGTARCPLEAKPGGFAVLFFVLQDCPISNYYAREIRRVCDRYGPRGVSCTLVHVDPHLSDAAALAHANEYGHRGYPVVVDRQHRLVKATGATVTPEVAVITDTGDVAYRGRINDFYAALGKSRRQVTDRTLRDAIDALLSGKPASAKRTQAVGCYIPGL